MKRFLNQLTGGIAGLALLAPLGAGAADGDYVANTVFSNQVAITFSGTTAAVASNAGDAVTVTQDGANVALYANTAGVECALSGAANAGSVKIYSDYPVKLTLSGVQLASADGPAIAINATNRCFVVLANGTSNALTDSTNYTAKADGTLTSTGPLIFSGGGSLAIAGYKKHAVCSETYLRFLGGQITVLAADKDGFHASDFIRLDNGLLNITASGDGLDAGGGYVEINGGAVTIQSASDNVCGIACEGPLAVNGGAVNIVASGARFKGMATSSDAAINGGTLQFSLAGNVYLKTESTYTTNSSVITTNYYVDPVYCAAIKCGSNLTVNAGSITVNHSGVAGRGLSADGNVIINGGTLDLATSGAASSIYTNSSKTADVATADCLKADGNLEIYGGTITALSTGNAGKGITTDGYAIIGTAGVSNTPVIKVATKGQKVTISSTGGTGGGMPGGATGSYSNPKAFKAVGNLTINGGYITASTANDGGEGIESKAQITINGGTIEVTSYDDGINAAKNITINGGRIYSYASNNDGIDSNGTLTINGGLVVGSGTTAPEEGLDCDQNTFTITGGTIIGTGGATSTPTSSVCKQNAVLYTGSGTAGVILEIKSASGDNLVYKLPRTYSGGGGGGFPGGGGGTSSGGMTMLISNPGLVAGTTYTIVSGATVTGGTEFHGVYENATVTGGTTLKTFTVSTTSKVTSVQ